MGCDEVEPTEPLDYRPRLRPVTEALRRLRPGMRIFVGTGVAEPRTLVSALMDERAAALEDLELIQLVSLGDAISPEALRSNKYRLKTFFPGYTASEAIAEGRVDWIPCDFAEIPRLFETGRIPVDAAFVQIARPDDSGWASLGVAVDAARQALDRASFVVGEVNSRTPRTLGDTLVHIDEFDLLVEATEPPLCFPRPEVSERHDRMAARVAALIDDGACLAFSAGPLYEALTRHLKGKRHLGVHTPIFTDGVRELVESGAVSNRRKEVFRGKSLTSYALGTAGLLRWLDLNPRVEFQAIDKVLNPLQIGRNKRFVAVIPAHKVDLMGRIAQPAGRGALSTGPAEAAALIEGARLSSHGRAICALPSRNRDGESNIVLSIDSLGNELSLWLAIDFIVTDYGEAYLQGRTTRERAQALIEVAHPDDRAALVEQARQARILYADQIFLLGSAHAYPHELETSETFGPDGLEVRFRAIRPSDEEQMRRLFYRFSDEAVYSRFFAPVRAMPHSRMQEYVNVDYQDVLSIVGVVGEVGEGTIIAEARYSRIPGRRSVDVAFVVDEAYQGRRIGASLLAILTRLASQRGFEQLEADVLISNSAMRKLMERSGLEVSSHLEDGVYHMIARLPA